MFPDSQAGYFLAGAGLRWYLDLRLVNRSFNSIIFANFLARLLAPKENIHWLNRRSLPPTDGAITMGKRILKAVLGSCGLNENRNAGGASEGLDSCKGRSHYSLANIIAGVLDEMVSFFSKSGAAASVDKSGGSVDAGRASFGDPDEGLRETYLDAIVSILGALGADRIIELLADWGTFPGRERDRQGPVAWQRVALMVTAYLGRVSEMKALMELPGIDLTSTPEEE
ncbi:hypothetical protein BJX63DRAFT_428263 [Aspergillus granulosus]|uniref:Uncharacterized protein n=1 Tax=Aspergillus granulosus TaxID=176169 RepID=A0ABR4I0B0_9EURO